VVNEHYCAKVAFFRVWVVSAVIAITSIFQDFLYDWPFQIYIRNFSHCYQKFKRKKASDGRMVSEQFEDNCALGSNPWVVRRFGINFLWFGNVIVTSRKVGLGTIKNVLWPAKGGCLLQILINLCHNFMLWTDSPTSSKWMSFHEFWASVDSSKVSNSILFSHKNHPMEWKQ